MTSPKNPTIRPDEAGFILPLVLIIVAIGAMVVIGLVGYATGLFRAGGQDTDALRELYAADAGVAHVKKLLQQEEESQCDEQLKIEVNSLEVNIRVICESTPDTAVPTPQPAPIIDLELPENHLRPYPVTLYSVPEGTKVDISWAFTLPTPVPTSTPVSAYPSVAVFAGLGEGTPIATTDPIRETFPEGKQWLDLTDLELLDDETFVVNFDPGMVRGLVSDPFTEECDSLTEPHFCLTSPPMDYIVISKAGQTTVTAYLRQMPKWVLDVGYLGRISYTFSGGEVDTLSWKPYPPDE